MGDYICGIQQVGIGTNELEKDWKWYREVFGMDLKIFVDAADAPLMTEYTGGKVQNRVAALALNMQGGGGFEIWQYKSREPQPASFDIALGDLGFAAVKIKVRDAKKAYRDFKKQGLNVLTEPLDNGSGTMHFYLADEKGNWFDLVESDIWFTNEGRHCGGTYGAVIGVSDMDKSMAFYKDLLGFDMVLSDKTEVHPDFEGLRGGDVEMRRVILGQSSQGIGHFTPLLGPSQIELLQRMDGSGRKIFKDRFWGDLGFIHLCFDVKNMTGLKEMASELQYPFTVDSADSFDMGKAAGRFGYVEDPDGALIEFVETHKIPVVEKWGWFLDIQNRKPGKSLPRWMLKCFKFNRVRD
ncbi:MAG TPA: VOC family protein [Cryomorphaceae bacterium]|nr:VOC family protein [Cryomorphaceae bacterium]